MSGVEIFGIAASVLQIADLGAKVSVKLFGFARKVRGAAEKIDLISKEIAATGALLQQLSEQLDKDSQAQLLRRELVESAHELVRECKKIFRNIDKAIDGNSGNKIILSLKQKIHYTYVESEIDALRANLENLKSSIGIMQNVLIYAEQLRNRERFPVLKEQQDLLKTLGEEKLANEQRYNTLMQAITERSDSRPEPSRPPVLASTQLSTVHVPLGSRSENLAVEDFQISSPSSPPSHLLVSTGLDERELREYVSLVAHMLEEVHSTRYRLDRSMRHRVHNGVLDLHWQEWAPFRQAYKDEVLLRKFSQLPELLPYWENKIKQEERKGYTRDDSSSKILAVAGLSSPRVFQSVNSETRDSKLGAGWHGEVHRMGRSSVDPRGQAEFEKLKAEEALKESHEREKKCKDEMDYQHEHRRVRARSQEKVDYERKETESRVQTPLTYTRVKRKYVSPQALKAFGLDWESDEEEPNCMIIKQDLSPALQEQIFQHTRRLRAIDAPRPNLIVSHHHHHSRHGDDDEPYGLAKYRPDRISIERCRSRSRSRYSTKLPPRPIVINSSGGGGRAEAEDQEAEATTPPPPPIRSPLPQKGLDINALVSQWTTLSPREIARGSEMARR